MKKNEWSTEDIIKVCFSITVCASILIYFCGMFILKQATNEMNKDLRLQLVTLLAFIAGQLLGRNSAKSNEKNDEEKENK